jgi:hypothetical protein
MLTMQIPSTMQIIYSTAVRNMVETYQSDPLFAWEGLGLGDAKAANALVKNDDDTVLIKYGCGAINTERFSPENYETVGGGERI